MISLKDNNISSIKKSLQDLIGFDKYIFLETSQTGKILKIEYDDTKLTAKQKTDLSTFLQTNNSNLA